MRVDDKPDPARVKALAEAHADWLFALLRRVYEDALVHGYGHGWEDARKQAEGPKGE
jgi:hypothetical protein